MESVSEPLFVDQRQKSNKKTCLCRVCTFGLFYVDLHCAVAPGHLGLIYLCCQCEYAPAKKIILFMCWSLSYNNIQRFCIAFEMTVRLKAFRFNIDVFQHRIKLPTKITSKSAH